MACESFEKKLATLRSDETEQEALIDGGLVGHSLGDAKARLAQIRADVAAAERDLADCRAGMGPVTTTGGVGPTTLRT